MSSANRNPRKSAPSPRAANQASQGKSKSNSSRNDAQVVSVNVQQKAKKPIRTVTKDGCRIKHEEYIQEVNGSVAYDVATYSVNPGLPSLFPWLSAIASRYESYHFHNLRFSFRTSTNMFQTTGKILLGMDYDATDSPPGSKVQFMALDESISAVPYQSFVHSCKTMNLSRSKMQYTRGGTVPTGSDVKLYDVGNLFVAQQGQPNTDNQGELYVEYDVEFFTPQLEPCFPSARLTPISPSPANPFGVSCTVVGMSPFEVEPSQLTALTSGQFLLSINATGGAPLAITLSSSTATVTSLYAYNNANVQYATAYLVQCSPNDIITASVTGGMSAYDLRVSSYVTSNA